MTQIELTLRAMPWEPTPSSHMSHQLAFYDIPLSGIIRQRHSFWRRPCYFLFWCAAGGGSEHGVWLYAPLRRGESHKLKNAIDKELMTLQMQIVSDRKVTVVLAHHVHGIEYAAVGRLSEFAEQPAENPVTSAGRALDQGLNRDRAAVDSLFAPA